VNEHVGHPQALLDPALLAVIGVALAAVVYLGAALAENRRGGRGWPWFRAILWLAGLGCIAAVLVGPLAKLAHTEFPAHMIAHLAVGMLAPVLLVLAAPVTLALRTLHVVPARRIARLLGSGVFGILSHPVPAATINVGSLWLLYATGLGAAMLQNPVLHYLLLTHLLVTGYLFTASIIGVDPAPHRAGYRLRLVVLVLAIALHSALAKYIYVHPPEGTTAPAAELGALLMFYGGDLVELVVVTVFFSQWYRRPRTSRARVRVVLGDTVS
jgi:putative membrane protein